MGRAIGDIESEELNENVGNDSTQEYFMKSKTTNDNRILYQFYCRQIRTHEIPGESRKEMEQKREINVPVGIFRDQI